MSWFWMRHFGGLSLLKFDMMPLSRMNFSYFSCPVKDSRPRTGASRKEASSRPISAVSLKGRPKPESRPVSRPTTGVSRPSSKQSSMAPVSSKVTHKSSKESLVAGHPQLSIKLSDKSLKLDDPKLDEYVEAFSARPKIPRSPESGGAEKEFVEIERPFSGSPPPPTKSASPPRHDKMQLRSSSRSSSRSQSILEFCCIFCYCQ
eukprot:m.236680 g.236680  ORF g.236680 m.236680 type:complete len:204 (+) comp40136_c0_seq36:2585-3196(+)